MLVASFTIRLEVGTAAKDALTKKITITEIMGRCSVSRYTAV